MRIIGGSLKGKIISPPPHFTARPTTDFAKEGLFNMLTNEYDLSSIKILDLFGGSGSISIEFASRGCANITCVEMNPLHASFIKKTVEQLHLKQVRVVRHNVFDFIPLCTQTYDLVFADPPYDLTGLAELPKKICSSPMLGTQGVFILEHPANFDFTREPKFVKTRKYGNVHFSFFQNADV